MKVDPRGEAGEEVAVRREEELAAGDVEAVRHVGLPMLAGTVYARTAQLGGVDARGVVDD